MLPLLVAQLLTSGLGILGNAVLAKGKNVIEEKLGVDIETELATPEGQQILAQKQVDHEEFLITSALEEKRIVLADVASARDMQKAALGSGSILAQEFIYWYAAGWSLFAAAYIAAITFYTVPPESVRFADTVLGFLLGTIIANLLQFFFGSTVRNGGKDNTIASLVEQAK
jgi:hypothetical protein